MKMNVYTRALVYTMVIGATSHLVLLAIYALTSGRWEMLNAFDILDIDLFMPSLGKGYEFFAISWFFIGVAYVTVLVCVMKQMKKGK